MDLQDFQKNYTTRIKFAITAEDDLSQYVSANNRYGSLWDSLPEGWFAIQDGTVKPEPDSHPHAAKLLSTPSGDIVAVEHETGLEIVAVGAGVVSAAAAVVALYQTWRRNRRGLSSNQNRPAPQAGRRSSRAKASPAIVGRDALVVENREMGLDGVIKMTTMTIPAHLVTTELLTDLISARREK